MLVVARDLTGYTSYEDLTVKLFGRKMGLLVEVNIIVFCFGTGVAYLIAVGDILEPVFENTGLDHGSLVSSREHLGTTSLADMYVFLFNLTTTYALAYILLT